MNQVLTGPAQVYVYDIQSVLRLLEPAMISEPTRIAGTIYGKDGLVDIFIAKTIHDFQIMTVLDYNPLKYPADLINHFNQQVAAVSELWNVLWIPPECSGSQVIVRRVRSVIWLIVIDPARVQPLQKLKTEHAIH